MQVNINIEATIAAALEKALNPSRIAETIEEQVCKTVDSVIEQEFRSYGEFGKSVKAALVSIVPHDISIDGQSKYRDLIMKIVSGRIQAFADERLGVQLEETLGSILEQPPTSIKMSDLAKKAVELWDGEMSERGGSEKPTIIVERVEGTCDGYHHIFLDPKEGCSKYECRCQIDVQDTGRAYSVKVRSETVGKSLFIGPVYDFDRYLLWLYTGGTKIEVDQYDFYDLYYNQSEED